MQTVHPTQALPGTTLMARALLMIAIAVLVLVTVAVLVMSTLASTPSVAPDAGTTSAGSNRPAFVQPHVEGKTGP
jgi:hypothetical protein